VLYEISSILILLLLLTAFGENYTVHISDRLSATDRVIAVANFTYVNSEETKYREEIAETATEIFFENILEPDTKLISPSDEETRRFIGILECKEYLTPYDGETMDLEDPKLDLALKAYGECYDKNADNLDLKELLKNQNETRKSMIEGDEAIIESIENSTEKIIQKTEEPQLFPDYIYPLILIPVGIVAGLVIKKIYQNLKSK